MNKLKKVLLVLISVFCFVIALPQEIAAETKFVGYTIDTSSLSNDMKYYISSMRLDAQEDGSFALYVNNVYIGSKSGDVMNFTYNSVNPVATVNITIDIPNRKVSASATESIKKTFKSAFAFNTSADGEKVYATFYPNADSLTGVQTSEEKASANKVYAFNFNANYSGSSKAYKITLDSNAGKAYVEYDGIVETYNVGTGKIDRTLYFEWLVPQHPLEMKYFEKELEPYSFAQAKEITYPEEQFEKSIENEQIKGYNKGNNAWTEYFSLEPEITYWERIGGTDEIGTGIYGQQLHQVTVVCQWWDTGINNKCVNLRESIGEDNRYFAVFGENTQYDGYETSYFTYISDTPIYDENNWVNVGSNFPTGLPEGTKIQYRYKNGTWGDFGTPTTYYLDSCSSNVDCDYQSSIKYAKKSGSWGDWGSETTYYLDSCSSNVDCDYQSRDEYSNYLKGANQSGYTSKCQENWYSSDSACGTEYVYSNYLKGINKSGSYQSKCEEIYEKNSACGTYNETCETSACGVDSYSKCRTSSCGCEKRNSCQSSECGRSSCQDSSCGCASYKSCPNGADCGYEVTCKKGSTTSTYSGTSCPSGYTKVSTKTKTCQTPKCGCSYFYSCVNNNCSYKSCQAENCSCETYASCRTSSCGVESYKTCTHSDCGTGTNSCYLWSCPSTQTTQNGSCYLWSCPQNKTTYYQYKYRSWSDYSDYIYSSCTETETNKCKSATYYEYRYRSWGDWSSWFDTNKNEGSSTETLQLSYRKNEPMLGEIEDVEIKYKPKNTTVGRKAEQTQSEIYATQDEVTEDVGYAYSALYMTPKVVDGISRLLLSEAEKYIDTHQPAIKAEGEKQFINQEIFIPYFYITEHLRAVDQVAEIDGYDNSCNSTGSPNTSCPINIETTTTDVTSQSNIPLNEYNQELSRSTKVIYYDYRRPLTNYVNELPENWKGYEYLLDEIRNQNFDEYIISAELSKQDLIDMKNYLLNGGYEDTNCNMLKEFAHIFKTKDGDLSDFLNGISGCVIEPEREVTP